MGKRKITNEGSLDNMILPSPNDVLGVAVKMLGAERVTVKCQDGKERPGLPRFQDGKQVFSLRFA